MYRKFKRVQKDRVLEACRLAAEMLKTTSFPVTSDASAVCRNTAANIGNFTDALKTQFDAEAWDHTVTQLITRMPTRDKAELICVYDFYRALNDVHYFSAEAAIKRIREFGRLKALPYHRSRSNIRGVYRECSSSVQWFVNEINANWKQFLAIGARLCTGDERSLYWKNYHAYRETPIKAIGIDHTQFDIHVQGSTPEQTLRQVEMFLAYVGKDVFAKIVRPTQYCYRITVEKNTPELEPAPVASQEVKAVSEYQSGLFTSGPKDPFRLEGIDGGNPNFVMLKANLDIISPKHTLIEEHYAGEIEKSINEITTIVDDYDRQIDELTAKADKMRAQRGKLLRAYKALTE